MKMLVVLPRIWELPSEQAPRRMLRDALKVDSRWRRGSYGRSWRCGCRGRMCYWAPRGKQMSERDRTANGCAGSLAAFQSQEPLLAC